MVASNNKVMACVSAQLERWQAFSKVMCSLSFCLVFTAEEEGLVPETRQKEQRQHRRQTGYSLVIPASHTVVEPSTMMVEVGNTFVTGTAVL